jgi:hypothetical protein
MKRKIWKIAGIGVWMLGALLSAACAAHAQTPPEPYPAMAPLAQYLMTDRDAEIQLARSAAPAAISDHANVLVLGTHGYESAVEGSMDLYAK